MKDAINTLLNYTDLLLSIGCFGLFVALFCDFFQFYMKIRGASLSKVASGYAGALKVNTINRVGAVCYFFLVAVCIDGGTKPATIATYMLVCVCASIAPPLLYLIRLAYVSEVGQGPLNIRWVLREYSFLFSVTYIAVVVNISGLTVPWLASASFPDLRLTLANTTFAFNVLFTVITVFIIETRLAKLIDDNPTALPHFMLIMAAARVGGYATFAFLLGIFRGYF